MATVACLHLTLSAPQRGKKQKKKPKQLYLAISCHQTDAQKKKKKKGEEGVITSRKKKMLTSLHLTKSFLKDVCLFAKVETL